VTTVIIIGAGPAGLAAALAALDGGARVLLLDSADDVGGQYWRHLPATRPSRHESLLHLDWSKYCSMRERLETDSRCEIVTSAHVWAIEGGKVFVLVGEPDGADRDVRVYPYATVVMATGAFDRALPVPGWELPGVFTAGGAQALAKGERVAVGRRVAVGGTGPFLLPVATSLVHAGSTVVGVYEASHVSRLLRGWTTRPWELLGAAGKAREGIGYAASLVRNRIPYVTGHAITAIHGAEKVEAVTVTVVDGSGSPVGGARKVLEVDAVCLGHGFTPRLELPIAAGCQLSDRRFVAIDENQRTSVPGVFAAGEITGIGGVDLALAEGAIAGHVAAGGRIDDAQMRPYRARRRTYRHFATRLDAAHTMGTQWTDWLTGDTIICRCEEVSFERLCSAVDASQSAGLRSLKLLTRAGLGICQGRVCGRTVEELLSARTPGGRLIDGVSTDRRPIAVPIRLGELAGDFITPLHLDENIVELKGRK
jgi:NADPH-dependent 2,4-dienoyl-CoA reductase/sulfur reductase-like enzyme